MGFRWFENIAVQVHRSSFFWHFQVVGIHGLYLFRERFPLLCLQVLFPSSTVGYQQDPGFLPRGCVNLLFVLKVGPVVFTSHEGVVHSPHIVDQGVLGELGVVRSWCIWEGEHGQRGLVCGLG